MPLLADEDLEVSKRYGVTAWLGPLARFTELEDVPGGRYIMRAIFIVDGEGIVRYRHVSRTGCDLPVGRRHRAGAGFARLMPAGIAEPRTFTAGEGLTIRGESAGEGLPVVLCHGLTATRRSVIHGSRALERAGHTVVTYDARGHGESDPAPAGQGYGYPELVGDLESVDRRGGGRGPVRARRPLDGRSHGGGLRAAAPRAPQRPRRDRAELRRVDIPSESLGYWDGLADALEAGGVDGFVELHRPLPGRSTRPGATRSCASPASGCSATVIRRPWSMRCARCRARGPFGELDELESIEVPALVVASHDAADPGHPYAVAERLRRALAAGAADQRGRGGVAARLAGRRLSREIATFASPLKLARKRLQ